MQQAKATRATTQNAAAFSALSICTVSRALRSLRNVSVDAQAKCRHAPDKPGYRACPAGSRLAGGSTGSVAIVAPTATARFLARAVEAPHPPSRHVLETKLIERKSTRRRR